MFPEAPSNEDLAKMLCNLSQQRPSRANHDTRTSSDDTSSSSSSSSSSNPSPPRKEQSGSDGTRPASPSPPAVVTSQPATQMAAAPMAAAPMAASTTTEAPSPQAAPPAHGTRPTLTADPSRSISLSSTMSSVSPPPVPTVTTSGGAHVPPPILADFSAAHQIAASHHYPTEPQTAAAAMHNQHTPALPSFPVKLFEMMQDAPKQGFEDVVSWQPARPSNSVNSSFKVHSTDRFVNEVMPRYFKQTKFKSFQRQLNIYGFQRIHDGPNRGGYMHPYFQQTAPELLKLIPRKRAPEQQFVARQGNQHPSSAVMAAAAAAAPHTSQPAPAPTSIQSLLQAMANNGNNGNNLAQGITNDQLFTLLQTAASVTEDEATRHRVHQSLLLLNAAQQLPPATLASAAVALGAAASIPVPAPAAAAAPTAPPPEVLPAGVDPDVVKGTDPKNQHVFPWKLYKMLDEAELPGSFRHIVSWVQGGKSFKVHNTKEFVNVVMPQYFDQTKYESFRRQLNLYGFTRIVRGQHRGVYSHPLFQRGHKDWCRFITRNQPSQTSDNSNSNNSMAFPLPPVLGKGDGGGGSPPATAPAPANVTNTTTV